ncbi:MAG: gamma-glutamylcyclotransferase [Nitrosopumilus sp.]|nr:gamma-glutamylcyclotransferase [Nitrosopumilus sp.]CAI9832276.1 conserved hypothetical protein [Nitrosopumilaceae archaeon]MDA7941804.1 gamma-glutamylcyclotransferase [Nitrosopumilus sp.]MDA7943055.1 gamma-glutamylcyclotransferase [Nitrosopumilus sp.]MDA7953513.1 gamma-glutamylcyclotransferase [Nitrosopumilus sp.]
MPEVPLIRVFAYGLLMDAGIREGILGRKAVCRPSRVSGYAVSGSVEVEGTEYPAASASDGGDLEGGILKVTQAELGLLDDWMPDSLDRISVTLEGTYPAWMYVLEGHR